MKQTGKYNNQKELFLPFDKDKLVTEKCVQLIGFICQKGMSKI